MRSWLSVCLACALALGSVTMAVARGMASPDHVAVICSEAGVISLHLDAQGNPTGPGHLCPDCVTACGGLPAAQPAQAPEVRIVVVQPTRAEGPQPRPRGVWPFQPRAPPVLV